jgi:hypothetical protein
MLDACDGGCVARIEVVNFWSHRQPILT